MIGTGDLSELALGWCTYGVGDHMSHYGVNAGVPKTLIQYLIRWVIQTGQFTDACGEVLAAILDTEISPELVPPGADGQIQSTEELVGPYELNDFFLHHVIRFGQRPSKVAFLAWHAWRAREAGLWPAGFPDARKNAYELATIAHWLDRFVHRFFRLLAVQALRAAQWAEGVLGRRAVPARRLARAVGRGRHRVARGTARKPARRSRGRGLRRHRHLMPAQSAFFSAGDHCCSATSAWALNVVVSKIFAVSTLGLPPLFYTALRIR